MLHLQAQRFCQQGYTVLIVDLFGTGDSSGEFGAATWQIWRENLHHAWTWLNQEKHISHIHFWGVRLGSLLALDTAAFFRFSVASFLFWQPVINGERFVTQLLRMKIAEQFGRNSSETVKTLRERSIAGETLEIGGYAVNPELLTTLEQIKIVQHRPESATPVVWLECSSAEAPELLPPSRKQIEKWQAEGHAIAAACVTGPSFWNSVEIEEVPDLIEQTSRLFAEANHVRA